MKEDIKERIEMINRGEVPEGYKRSKLGIIPEDWNVVSFGNVFNVNQGLQIPISERFLEPAPNRYFYITNLFLKSSESEGEIYYIENPTENVICHSDDILMTRTGNTGLVLTNVTGVFHNNFFKIKFDREKFNKDYVYYYLGSYYCQKMIRIYAGINTIPDLNHGDFYKILFMKCSLTEQQKIALSLSTWDCAIKLKEKLLKQKKLQKKGLIQRLLTGKKRFTGFNGKWQTLKAGEIFKNSTDKTHGGVGEVLSASQEKGIIPRSQIEIDIKYNPESVISYKKVDVGDFVISLRSFQGGIEYSGYEGLVSPAYTVLKNRLPIDAGFYKELFKSQSFIKRLNSVIYGIRDGKQIGYDDFCMLKLPYPHVDEQHIISKVLETAEFEIRCIQQELEQLKLQKKGLMQLLLTGKARVAS